jgi:exopolysaccharide production protein ExoZ
VHEIVFYALFSLFFLSRRLLLGVLVAWGAAIVGVWLWHVPLAREANYFLSPLNLCFLLGAAVAGATRSGVNNVLGLLLGAGGLVLVASQASMLEPIRVLLALGFAGLVAASRAPAIAQVSPGPVLMGLGAASYSIYLVHDPAISLAVRAGWRIPPAGTFVAIAAAALCAGLAYHFLYERHAVRWARSRLTSKRMAQPVAAASDAAASG